MLTTWLCPHSLAAALAIDRYFTPDGPTAAGHAQEVIEANCYVRLGHSETVYRYFSGKISII